MSSKQAKRLVVVSLLVVSVLALIEQIAGDESPDPRVLVGATIAGVGLAGVAEVAPRIAGGLAAVALVTSSLVLGAPAWRALSTATEGPRS